GGHSPRDWQKNIDSSLSVAMATSSYTENLIVSSSTGIAQTSIYSYSKASVKNSTQQVRASATSRGKLKWERDAYIKEGKFHGYAGFVTTDPETGARVEALYGEIDIDFGYTKLFHMGYTARGNLLRVYTPFVNDTSIDISLVEVQSKIDLWDLAIMQSVSAISFNFNTSDDSGIGLHMGSFGGGVDMRHLEFSIRVLIGITIDLPDSWNPANWFD
ncbi:hypothetical protein ACFLW2_04475, partial [Chloroflexota bacterium]